MVEEAQHHRELISKMLKKMSQREVLGAFTKWKEATDEAHNARAAAARAIGFFFTSATRGAFIAFQRNAAQGAKPRSSSADPRRSSSNSGRKTWRDCAVPETHAKLPWHLRARRRMPRGIGGRLSWSDVCETATLSPRRWYSTPTPSRVRRGASGWR